jgi:hypothetical protein
MSTIKTSGYIIKKTREFFKDTTMFIYFFLCLVRHKSFSNPIKRQYSGTVTVLANGPSLKEVIPCLTTDNKFRNSDFVVMNFFAFDNVFFEIKPKHYCLSDIIFMQSEYSEYTIAKQKQVLELFKILQEKVDWDLTIYVPKCYFKDHLSYSKLTNPFIKHVPLNIVKYSGYESFRFFFYKNGLALPGIRSVAIVAIYAALNAGYSCINLYGVDHSFFDSLCVNDNNQLCNRLRHFYDNSQEELLKPIMRYDGMIYKISDYINGISDIFRGHDFLSAYAKFLHVKILNCTKGSMIDSYERK